MSPIEGIIAFSLRYRAAVIGATLALAAAGAWAFVTLKTDAFPDLTPNQVIVMTTSPGLSAYEAEQQVSYPIEVAMLGLPRTIEVRSIAKAGLSVVTVTFDDDVDLFFARAQVQQRLQDAMTLLPEGLEPMLGPPATAMGEVLHYLVERDTLAGAVDSAVLIDLTNVQEYIVKPLLRTVPGVAAVNSWGGMPQQYQVNADPARLAGYGLTLRDVEEALAANNANFGAGYLEDRGERLTVRGLGRVSDTTDIGNVVLATRGATPVRVRDVATVTIVSQPRYGAVSRDAHGEAITGIIQMLKGANGREVVGLVMARIEEIRPVLPPGVRIRPFYNQGDVVARTSATVFRNLAEGALLVIAVLFLFLRSARASLVTASVIPLALLAAFLAMRLSGVSANLMSLGALDFGLIVDASVVMVENFVRRLRLAPGSIADRTAVLREAAFEVGRPIVFGVAIIIAVYIPIFTLEGLEGRMFRPMAFTVCAAVLASLLLALTYVPAVASYVYAPRREHDVIKDEAHEDSRWFIALTARYERLLEWAMSHRRFVVGSSLTVLAIALGSVPFIGSEFMPKLDEGYLLIETRRIPSTSLTEGTRISTEVERTLKRFPEVANIVTNLGRPQEPTETMALNTGDVYVLFTPKSQWRARSLAALIPQLDSALAEIPGLDYEFSAPMAMRLEEVISGVKTDLGIKIYGDSLALLQQKAEEIHAVVAAVPGAEDVSIGVSDGAMQLEIDIDRDLIARYGLNVADVREAVETGVGGTTATPSLTEFRPARGRLEAAFQEAGAGLPPLVCPLPRWGGRRRRAAALGVLLRNKRRAAPKVSPPPRGGGRRRAAALGGACQRPRPGTRPGRTGLACGRSTLQQTQHLLRQLVGLGDHRVAGLLQDLRTAEVGGLRGKVGIHDAGAGRALVLDRDLQVGDHRIEARLRRTERGTLVVDRGQRGVDVVDHGVDRIHRGGVVDHAAARAGVVGARHRGHGGVAGEVDGRDVDGVVGGGVGAHLKLHDAGIGAQHMLAVEGGGAQHALDFLGQFAELLVQRILVAARVGGVGRLHRQLAHALQGVGHLAQRALRGLRHRDAVIGIAGRRVHAAHLRVHAFGDGQAGGIVLGRVDAHPRRQALHGGRQ